MKIQLTLGQEAIIDDIDYPLIAPYTWCAHRGKSNTYYAVTRNRNGDSQQIKMHRLIMGFPPEGVDHRDGNGLNNQRANLRLTTPSLNHANLRKVAKHTSRYKGVSLTKHKRWSAQITVDRRKHHLGYFDSEKEAAQVYNQAAWEVWGEHAYLNIINDV